MTKQQELEELTVVPTSLQKENGSKKCERELVTKWLHRILAIAGWNPQSIGNKYRVKEEVTGTDGRLDLALKINNRIVCCIEVKDPSVEIRPEHLLQALKYAASYYYPVNGVLDPIMAICTNGKVAYLMDPAVADPIKPNNHTKIDLTTTVGLQELISVLTPKNLDMADGSIGGISTKRKNDVREFASNTHNTFKDFIFQITDDLIDKGFGKFSAVEMTVLVLLLAAARDNCIIPTSVINKCVSNSDWKTLSAHLNKIFGDVFSVNSRMQKFIWVAYEETTFLNLRLDIVPVHFMGIVYQELLTKYCNNKTSFYTPEEMINKVLEDLHPKLTDSILDPTCGSGAFLVSAMEKGISNTSTYSEKELFDFFSSVVGVDKDPMAVKIAKVSLLCQFMRIVGDEYQKTGKSLPRPRIERPIDFFDWQGEKFSLILGNPPWESIDKLNKKRKKQLSNGSFESYQDKNDQLCYIVEKSIEKHLKQDGRFGFIIKQQSLLGNKYKNFCEYLDRKINRIYDYGNEMKFGNYAQSAIILGNTDSDAWEYSYLYPLETAHVKTEYTSYNFVDNFTSTRGAQTGGTNDIYVKAGQKFKNSQYTKLYPKTLNLGGPPKKLIPMYYFLAKPPAQFTKWILKNPKLRAKLEARGDVTDSISDKNPKGRNPHSWRRNSVETKLSENILVTERNLTPGKTRFPIFITTQTESLPMDGQTVIGSNGNNVDDLKILGSLLVSKYFVPLARGCKLIPRRAGGIFMNPKTIHERLQLPRISQDDREHLLEIVNSLEENEASPATLESIDNIWEQYFEMSKQSDEIQLYDVQNLSEFLHPDNRDGDEDELELDETA